LAIILQSDYYYASARPDFQAAAGSQLVLSETCEGDILKTMQLSPVVHGTKHETINFGARRLKVEVIGGQR